MAERPLTTEVDKDMPWEPNPALGETDDDSLILWFLTLTPTERLEFVQEFIDGIWMLRNGRSAA
jgi:hypothetical protein